MNDLVSATPALLLKRGAAFALTGKERIFKQEAGDAAVQTMRLPVISRDVSFSTSANRSLKELDRLSMPAIYSALAKDEARNAMIFDDVLTALEAGRSPLLLTERLTL